MLVTPTNTFDTSAAGNWLDKLRDTMRTVLAQLVTQGVPKAPGTWQPRTGDVRGITVRLGDNDCWQTGAGVELGEVFAAKVGPFIDTLRAYFTTRIRDDEDLAIAFVRPKPHDDDDPDPITGGSTHGTAVGRRAMRDAIDALPSQYPRVSVVDIDDLELERKAPTTRVHHGLQMTLETGYPAAQALMDLGTLTGGGSGGSPGDDAGDDLIDGDASLIDGSATFVVENGTGMATANSYCSVDFADTFHANLSASG